MSSGPDAGGPQKTLLGPVSRILAIRFARLGDVILLLPAMLRLRAMYPEAHITLMTGEPYAPLARLCPHLDEVVGVDRLAMRDGPRLRTLRDILALVRSVRLGAYDLVIDFHSFRETNLLAWLSGARFRLGLKRTDRAYLPFCFNLEPVAEDKRLHLAETFSRVVGGLPGATDWGPASAEGGMLVPSGVREDVRHRYVQETAHTPLVAVYAGASVASRRWPPERFSAVVEHAVSEWGATVLILSGATPGERAIAERIAARVGPRDRIRLLSGLAIPELAAAIGLSRLLVSNDTGPMHLGPALGTPTLGIFSESLPEHYRPIGPGDRYVKKDTVDSVSVEEVVEVMDQMWPGAGRVRN